MKLVTDLECLFRGFDESLRKVEPRNDVYRFLEEHHVDLSILSEKSFRKGSVRRLVKHNYGKNFSRNVLFEEPHDMPVVYDSLRPDVVLTKRLDVVDYLDTSVIDVFYMTDRKSVSGLKTYCYAVRSWDELNSRIEDSM